MTILLEHSQDGLKKAAALIETGKTVLLSNGLMFGFCTNALMRNGVENLHKMKQRRQPFSVCVPKKDAARYAHIPEKARPLIEKYWPGYLSFIFRKKESIPDDVTAGAGDTVCLVCLKYDIDEMYSKGYTMVPMAVTSGNRHGQPQISTWEKCLDVFKGEVDAIVMSEACPENLAAMNRNTTQVSFLHDPPEIFRPGHISLEEVKKMLPNIQLKNVESS